MAATTPETFPHVGRMGLPIFVGLRGMNIPELAGHVRRYREAWREAGGAGGWDRCLPGPGVAAPPGKGARGKPGETNQYLFRGPGRPTPGPIRPSGVGP